MAEQVCGSVKNELIISLPLLGGMAISLIARPLHVYVKVISRGKSFGVRQESNPDLLHDKRPL